jgi:DNA gyrase subunit A
MVALPAVDAGDETVFTLKEDGYGKRSETSRYPVQGRAGKGVIDIKCDEQSGGVVGIQLVKDTHDLIVMTKDGVAIRLNASSVSVIGRNTKGVRVINPVEGDRVVSVGVIKAQESPVDGEGSAPEDEPGEPGAEGETAS